jgi:hypothetical protein
MSCVELNNCTPCMNGSGQRCDKVARKCVPDVCCGNTCDAATQFCDVNTGACVGTCVNVDCQTATTGKTCVNGMCVTPKCTGRMCPERQLCDPQSGMCVQNKCADTDCNTAVTGLVCVAGTCVQDTCPQLQCPSGFKCSTSPIDGSHSCDMPIVPPMQQDRIQTGGGGGFALGCAVARDSSTGGGSLGTLVGAALALALARRRRRS